jgi:hypothetical protein
MTPRMIRQAMQIWSGEGAPQLRNPYLSGVSIGTGKLNVDTNIRMSIDSTYTTTVKACYHDYNNK